MYAELLREELRDLEMWDVPSFVLRVVYAAYLYLGCETLSDLDNMKRDSGEHETHYYYRHPDQELTHILSVYPNKYDWSNSLKRIVWDGEFEGAFEKFKNQLKDEHRRLL